MTDAEFLTAFEACRMTREEWTHEAHVRLGWILLRQHPFDRALALCRSGLERLNSVIGGTVGYHETITRAHLILIQTQMKRTGATGFEDFKARCPDLMASGLKYLREYYSQDLLYSPRAKLEFVAPDLKSLPLAIDL